MESPLSRKLGIVIAGLVLISGGAVAFCLVPAFSPGFPTFTGAIIGMCAVYITGNVADSYLSPAKVPGQPQQE